MTRRFPVLPAVVVILVALAVAAVAAAGWRSEPDAASPQLSLASKQLRLTQTQAHKALIKMPNTKPGQVAKGTTRVTITGIQGHRAGGGQEPARHARAQRWQADRQPAPVGRHQVRRVRPAHTTPPPTGGHWH